MGWFPCGCCCPAGDKVLVWGDFGDFTTVDEAIAVVFEATGLQTRDETTWDNEPLDNYGLIFVFEVQGDPPWWSQLEDWAGTLVLISFANPAARVWVNSKSAQTGMTIGSSFNENAQPPAIAQSDPLTSGVGANILVGPELWWPVSGGNALFKSGTPSSFPFLFLPPGEVLCAHFKPDLIRYVVCSFNGLESTPDGAKFLRNLYTQRPRPTCTPRTDNIGSTTGGIEWGFSTGALLGLGRLQSVDGAANGPTFTLAGNLTSGTDMQALATSQFIFSTSATATASGALVGATSLTFGSEFAVVAGFGALSGATSLSFFAVLGESRNMIGHSFLTFSASGAIAGASPLAATSTLTFSPTARLITDAPVLSGSTSLTFTPTISVTGTANISGNASLTFSATAATTGAAGVSGSATLTFLNSGSVLATAPLSGSLTHTYLVTGHVTGAAPITGASLLTFLNTGHVTASAALSGSLTHTYLVTGHATATAPLSGSLTTTFLISGHVTASSGLTGTTSLTLSTTGAAVAGSVAVGATSLTFSPTAQLRGTGRLIGATSLTSSTQGILTGESGGDTDICTNCPNGMPESIPVTIPAGFCTDCPELAGVYILTSLGDSTCTVDYTDPDFPCGILNIQISFAFSTIDLVVSIGALTGEVRFQRSVSAPPWSDCFAIVQGPWTLIHDTSSTCNFAGGGFEPIVGLAQLSGSTSLTFAPAGDLGLSCSACGSNTPTAIILTLAGAVSSGTCGNCSELLDDFILTQNANGACDYSYSANITCGALQILMQVVQEVGIVVDVLINGQNEGSFFVILPHPIDCTAEHLLENSVLPNQCNLTNVVATIVAVA